jgi:hypothetical protein
MFWDRLIAFWLLFLTICGNVSKVDDHEYIWLMLVGDRSEIILMDKINGAKSTTIF